MKTAAGLGRFLRAVTTLTVVAGLSPAWAAAPQHSSRPILRHRITGDVICDNQFAIFTAAQETPSMLVKYTGFSKCYPGTLHVSINTLHRYLYIACWSDDSVAQGLLHDLEVDGVQVFSGNPRWKVTYTDSDQDSCSTTPAAVAATMAATIPAPPGGWVTPAVGCANPPPGFNCYGVWGHWPTIDQTANWIWYDSGGQVSTNAPFYPGFNHREFLIFRLDMGIHRVAPTDTFYLMLDDDEHGATAPMAFALGTRLKTSVPGPASQFLLDPRSIIGVFRSGAPIRIPNDPALIGQTLYGQSLSVGSRPLDAAEDPFGSVFEIRVE